MNLIGNFTKLWLKSNKPIVQLTFNVSSILASVILPLPDINSTIPVKKDISECIHKSTQQFIQPPPIFSAIPPNTMFILRDLPDMCCFVLTTNPYLNASVWVEQLRNIVTRNVQNMHFILTTKRNLLPIKIQWLLITSNFLCQVKQLVRSVR